jgi:hypothetical protein
MGNEKWMAVHTILLLSSLILPIVTYYGKVNSLTTTQVETLLDCTLYLMLGFIMNQVNSDQKQVWIHEKLDTNDSKEIMPYLSRQSSINRLLLSKKSLGDACSPGLEDK